jgi:hypothetical protein
MIIYPEWGGRKWLEAGEDCIMRNFITGTLHQTPNIIRVANQGVK